jgi:hypothetical protein
VFGVVGVVGVVPSAGAYRTVLVLYSTAIGKSVP